MKLMNPKHPVRANWIRERMSSRANTAFHLLGGATC